MLTALAAVTLTFFALRLAAADPVASLLAQGLMSVEQADRLRHALGYDLPLLQQYLHFLSGLAQGEFGLSLYSGQPVQQVLRGQLQATLQLGGLALAIAAVFGTPLGLLAAAAGSRSLRSASSVIANLATSLPVSITGVLALLLLSDLFAAPGLLLPALVLGAAASGPFARSLHAGLSSSLRSPFVLAARARGLRRGGRIYWHALRPALPPAISLLALQAAFVFSGTVVTEVVFSRPGLGRTLVRSILQGDYPVAQAIVGLAAVAYVGSQLVADGLGWALDPRTREAERR